jgi:hypothetical protein
MAIVLQDKPLADLASGRGILGVGGIEKPVQWQLAAMSRRVMLDWRLNGVCLKSLTALNLLRNDCAAR